MLPLIAPAILAGALISVTLSIDEFVITWFTVGAQPTLPTYIYTQIKFGVTPEVNAVATVLLAVTLIVLGMAAVVLGGARRPDRSPPSPTAGLLMRAAVFKGAGVVALEDVPDPGVDADDDVIIDVEACGICGTDVQILNVPPGHPADAGVVMGHEFIGRVQAVGAGAGLAVGQRVTVDPDPKCGVCRPCRAGRPASCENVRALGIFRDGALACAVKVPAGAVFPLSDGPSARIAALIEPLACVVNGVNKANPRPGESAIIFGSGAIGCLFLAMFKAAGAAPVVVVEPQDGGLPSPGPSAPTPWSTPTSCRRAAPSSCRMGRTSSSTPSEASSRRPSTMPPWAAGSSCSGRTRRPGRPSISTRSPSARCRSWAHTSRPSRSRPRSGSSKAVPSPWIRS